MKTKRKEKSQLGFLVPFISLYLTCYSVIHGSVILGKYDDGNKKKIVNKNIFIFFMRMRTKRIVTTIITVMKALQLT